MYELQKGKKNHTDQGQKWQHLLQSWQLYHIHHNTGSQDRFHKMSNHGYLTNNQIFCALLTEKKKKSIQHLRIYFKHD